MSKNNILTSRIESFIVQMCKYILFIPKWLVAQAAHVAEFLEKNWQVLFFEPFSKMPAQVIRPPSLTAHGAENSPI
jgi:hypothetical protein